MLHRAPDWRIPVAVVGAVVAAAIVALAIVLSNLGSSGPGSTTPASAGPRAGDQAAPHDASARGAIGSWPPGLSGWTVVLAIDASQTGAEATAHRLAARGISVGVLSTSEHPRLRPGRFFVFSRRYPGQAQAAAAAARLVSSGNPGAIVREIAQPGGI